MVNPLFWYFCHFYLVPKWQVGSVGGCGTVLEFELFY